MAASIADLFVSIGADIAQLKSGMAEAAAVIKSTGEKAQNAFDGVGGKLDSIGSSIKTLAGIAGVGLSFHFLKELVVGSTEAVASLADLGLKAGILPTQLSALIPAARLSGTSMDTIATAAGKLSKELVNIQQGTGKGIGTFRELGFTASDAARFLKEPQVALFEIAKASSKYADDGSKVAAMQRLMGKSAAELLPFLHDLAKEQELQSSYTAEQIAGAKLLSETWAQTAAATEVLKGRLAGELAPTLIALTRTFFGAADGSTGLKGELNSLIKEGTIREWAERGGLALARLADTVADGPRIWRPYAESVGFVITTLLDLATAGLGAITSLTNPLVGFKIVQGAYADFQKNLAAIKQSFKEAEAPPSTAFADRFVAALGTVKKEVADAAATAGRGGKSFKDFTQDIDKSADAAENAAIKYREALAQLQLAKEEANSKIGLDENKSAQDDLKTGFDRGLVSLREYYQQRNALQTEALNIETAQLQSKLAEQEALASDYYARALALRRKDNESAGAFAARYTQLVTAGTEAEAKAVKTKSDLAIAQNKYNAVGKDYIELLVAENRGVLQNNKALEESVKQAERENEEIGLTKSQLIDLNIQRVQQLKIDEQLGANRDDVIAYYDAQIDGLTRLGNAARKGEGIARVQDAFRELESIGRSIFDSLFEKGENTFAKLGQAVKKLLLDVLYQATVKPFLINVVANLTGVGSAALGGGQPAGGLAGLVGQFLGGGGAAGGAAGGGTGGIGSLLNLFGGGGGTGGGAAGLAGTAFNSFATSGVGAGLGLSTTVGGSAAASAAGGLSLGVEAGATATAGLTAAGTTIAAAIPVIGWVVAAAALIYSVVQANKKPSPAEGQFAIRQLGGDPNIFEDQAFTGNKTFGNIGFLDQGTKQFSGEAGQVLNKSVSDLLDLFASRYSKEQTEQAKTALQALQFPHFEGTFTTEDFLKKYGDKILKQVATTAFDVLDPALGHVIEGFEGTGESLTKFIGSLLIFDDVTKKLPADIRANLTAAIGNTQEGLQKALDFAGAFKAISDVLDADPLKDIAEARKRATPTGALDAAQENLRKVIDEFDGTSASANALTEATRGLYQAQVQLVAQIEQVRAALSSLFDDTIRSLQLSVLDNVGQQSFLENEIETLQQTINTSTDPAVIESAGRQLLSDATSLFNLEVQDYRDSLQGQGLTSDQIDTMVRTFSQDLLNNEFLPRINQIETNVDNRLEGLGETAQRTSEDLLNEAADKLTDAIQTMADTAARDADTAATNADSAAVNAEAANTQLDAANTPITVVIVNPTAAETNG